MHTASHTRSRGGFLSLGSSATTQRNSTSLTTAVATELGGARVTIGAGQGLNITASNILADHGVNLGAAGSSVVAGGDIHIHATGAAGDITVRGSALRAGEALRLTAEDDIALLGAANSATLTSSSRGSSAAVGVGIALGAGGAGPGLTLTGSTNRASAQGDDLTWSATRLEGRTLSLDSGANTTVRGALLSADRIEATVAGNLLIESLQDATTYQSRHSSTGGSLTLGPAPGASLSLGRGRIDSNFASVNEQSGLVAGDGGFSVRVTGNTTLMGGAITSTQGALDQGRNRFETGSLGLGDVLNQAGFSGESVAANLGNEMRLDGQLALSATGTGFGRDSAQAESLTQAAISGFAGNSAARTGDAPTGLAPLFDVERVQRELNAQVVITQRFGLEASQAITQFANNQRAALRELARNATTPEEIARAEQAIKDVNMQERALNILASALTGTAGSSITKEALSTAAEKMRDLMIEDSMKFAGVVDSNGTVLSNVSGESEGIRGDGVKVGGTRIDLDLLCGKSNERCVRNHDGSLKLDSHNRVQFDDKEVGMSLADFLEKTPEGKKMAGLTGGVQGAVGTLFGFPYLKGSWQDKLVESFSGTHDFIGGKASGLYDEQGNIRRGMTTPEKFLHDRWAEIAIPIAAPFAAADGASPELWKAIGIVLEAAR